MSDIVDACLAVQPNDLNDRALADWVETWVAPIATRPDAVEGLLQVLQDGVSEELLILVCSVLDAMRMNRENDEAGAAEAFAVVDRWTSMHGPSLAASDKMGLCQAFARAGLSVPDAIRLGTNDAPPGMTTSAGMEAPDIADLLGSLLSEDAKGYAAFTVVSEALSAMPEDAGYAFVSEMIRQGQPDSVDLGRYFLLASEPGQRLAAAHGFAALAENRGVDAVALSDMIQIRKWLPADAARQSLDRAIKTALRHEASGGAPMRPWRLHQMMVSLPDGTGSQSLVASASRGSEKAVAMLLVKTGHGVKDAYAIPCSSATEQRALLAQIEEGVGVIEVPPGYVQPMLARALADCLPPAPGLLDVAQMLGVDLATPDTTPLSAREIADPEGLVAELTPQKRGRLIGQSVDWPRFFDIAESWFLSDASLAQALDAAKTERQAEKAVWDALEVQRNDWAMIFARAAEVLRHAHDPIWRGFASVVLGLEAGRALKKTPIFEMIAALTLDVAEGQGTAVLQDPMEDDDEIAPEGKGELARLLKGSDVSGDSLNGYLTAVMIAPEFTTPDVWLPPLMTGLRTSGESSMQRLLDLVMLRFDAIRVAMMDNDVSATLRDAKDFGAWLSGFDQASALKPAWPKKALTKEDRKILSLIKDGARDANTRQTLVPLLPHWLNAMTERAME